MKTPFYMTYPLQTIYETELEYEKDIERMKEYYPKEVSRLLCAVEERCDELEYEGSRMYDENPDREMMRQEVNLICKRLPEDEQADSQAMVGVLFYHELYRRRCRYRRCHKWW